MSLILRGKIVRICEEKMSVSYLTYVYIALLWADVFWIILAIRRKDYDRLSVFVVCLFLFYIGYSSARYFSVPILFSFAMQ